MALNVRQCGSDTLNCKRGHRCPPLPTTQMTHGASSAIVAANEFDATFTLQHNIPPTQSIKTRQTSCAGLPLAYRYRRGRGHLGPGPSLSPAVSSASRGRIPNSQWRSTRGRKTNSRFVEYWPRAAANEACGNPHQTCDRTGRSRSTHLAGEPCAPCRRNEPGPSGPKHNNSHTQQVTRHRENHASTISNRQTCPSKHAPGNCKCCSTFSSAAQTLGQR